MADDQGFSRLNVCHPYNAENYSRISTEHSGSKKKNNVLAMYGNESTMNLNPLILTNIQSSVYFKGKFLGH